LAFPFVTEENFEGGTYASTHFDATNGTGQQVYGFRDLAAIPGAPAPYRGAYCFGFDISALSGANVYWQETGSWDMTAGTNDIYVRFALYVTDNIVMANTDEMILLHFWSGANTGEACIALNYTTANGLRLGIGDTSTASQFQTFTTGEWHTVELFFDPAGAGAGTIDGWLDGVAYTQVTGTHSDITSGVLGAIGVDAGTTTGHVFFDDLVTDDAQVHPRAERWANPIYDTDRGGTNDATNILVELKNTAARETVTPAMPPIIIKNGAYVSMSGTNPRALVELGKVAAWGSDAAVLEYGGRSK
jgi:hypothetical protein